MLQTAQRLNKRERRRLKRQGITIHTGMKLRQIQPLTSNQEKAFEDYDQGKDLFLHGTAGTGKTFLAVYHGMRDVLAGKFDQMIIIRSVVPSRDMGFLPGTEAEKAAVYEAPYYEIFSQLFNEDSAYDFHKQRGQVKFATTSFMRGITFENSIIVIDECQNMMWSEINTLLTRIGNGCRVILCGDTKQSDLTEKSGKHDLKKIIGVCSSMSRFGFVQMKSEDIVRSGFVRDFIMECERLGY